VEVTEVEVEAGLGEEAVEQAGPVLHPPEPCLHQGSQLIDVLPTRLASDRFRFD
jgi:hypothetical protein